MNAALTRIDDALEDVVVALQDRLDREASQPGNAEDVLDDHGAAERVADDQAEHRQERPEGVPERVPEDDGPLGHPLAAGRPDVRLAHLLEQ